jgi:hypothetical protein
VPSPPPPPPRGRARTRPRCAASARRWPAPLPTGGPRWPTHTRPTSARSTPSAGRFAAAALVAPPAPALELPPTPDDAAAAVPSALPSSPSTLASTVSPLSDENIDAPRHNATRGGGGEKASLSSTTTPRRMVRTSPSVPAVVYEDPYSRPQYAEVEARYVYVHGGGAERPSSPPEASPWDFFFNPFAHCDGFVEDYYRYSC